MDNDELYPVTVMNAAFEILEMQRETSDGAQTELIDSQLELLAWGIDLYEIPNRPHPIPLERRVLALAKAIVRIG